MTTTQDPYGPPPLPAPLRRQVTDEVPDDALGRVADGALSALLAVLGVGWFLLPPFLLLHAALSSWHLYGEPPSPAEATASHRSLALAAVTAVGLPAAGLLLALQGHRRLRRRRGAVAWFGVTAALAVCAVVGVAALGMVVDGRQPAPAPPRTHHCQELSGGDNECPGG